MNHLLSEDRRPRASGEIGPASDTEGGLDDSPLRAVRSGGARLPATPAGYVWHHFHNYDRFNNKGTMYLVTEAVHAVGHTGGVKQYEVAHGVVYG